MILGLYPVLLLFSPDYLKKPIDLKKLISSNADDDEVGGSKTKIPGYPKSVEQKGLGDGDGDDEEQCCGEDEVFDVMTMIEIVKNEG